METMAAWVITQSKKRFDCCCMASFPMSFSPSMSGHHGCPLKWPQACPQWRLLCAGSRTPRPAGTSLRRCTPLALQVIRTCLSWRCMEPERKHQHTCTYLQTQVKMLNCTSSVYNSTSQSFRLWVPPLSKINHWRPPKISFVKEKCAHFQTLLFTETRSGYI